MAFDDAVRAARAIRRPIATASIALSLCVACAGLGGPGESPAGTVWRVVEMGAKPVPRLEGGRAPTLRLDGVSSQASGFMGCNRMTTSFELEGDTLRFGLMATTRMACEPVATAVETDYMEIIEAVAHWRRREGRLELLDADRIPAMRLEPAGRIDTLPPKEER